MESAQHELIVVVLAEALVPRVMEVVGSAGSRSVTVVRGRGRDLVRPPQFLGVAIEPGREVLLLVVERDVAADVMTAIEEAGDLLKKGHGIAFAIQLSHVAGLLSLDDERQRPG